MPHYQIYYAIRPTFRPSGTIPVPPLTTRIMRFTHAYVTTVRAPSKAAAMLHMQAENWSPNGEAKSLIKSLGLRHTSMSIGDVIRPPNATYWELVDEGWRLVPDDRY